MSAFRRTSHGPAIRLRARTALRRDLAQAGRRREAGHYVRSAYCFRQAGHRQRSYFERISARAASVSVTLLHQQPDSDSSHANGCPHDSQCDGRLTIGPDRLHAIWTFTDATESTSLAGRVAQGAIALRRERARAMNRGESIERPGSTNLKSS